MLFRHGIVLFCQARCFFLRSASKNLRTPLWFVKSMESAARTLLETFLPIGRQPPGERHKVLDVTLHFLNAWSFSGGTASRKWIPIPRQKTRCSELFSAVLRKNAVS